MLDHAATKPTLHRVQFRQADALQLPFDDQSFDAVVCQFGVMFFPDRSAAFREANRVLRPGGRFLFNVWESPATNPIVTAGMVAGLSQRYPDHGPGSSNERLAAIGTRTSSGRTSRPAASLTAASTPLRLRATSPLPWDWPSAFVRAHRCAPRLKRWIRQAWKPQQPPQPRRLLSDLAEAHSRPTCAP